MTTATRPECDTCHKVMSIAQAVVMVVAGVTYVLCLDCTLSQLEDDDSFQRPCWGCRGVSYAGSATQRG